MLIIPFQESIPLFRLTGTEMGPLGFKVFEHKRSHRQNQAYLYILVSEMASSAFYNALLPFGYRV